jgi:hypothetical protein
MSWIVFVGESHAALYGKRQTRYGSLENHRILIASVVELLCYFLVSCSGNGNASLLLRESNPRIEGSATQGFIASGILNGRHGVISDVPWMHEAIGEDIAESRCFLMVTLRFGRVNSAVVWGCGARTTSAEAETASKRCRAEARRYECKFAEGRGRGEKRKRDPSTAVGMT